MKQALRLCTAMLLAPLVAMQAAEDRASVGAIRWDAWCGDLIDNSLATERSLGPGKYHHRLPFYGAELSKGAALARFTAQNVMDQEIAYAKNAGLDYWAFLYHADGTWLDLAHDLYLASAHRDDIGFCMVVQSFRFDDTAIGRFVEWFQLPCYHKVAGGRPLLYFFDTAGISKTKVDQLRGQAIAAGLPTPYLVSMGSLGDVTALGLDAVSAYTQFSGNGDTYASYATTFRGLWDSRRNAGYKVIPWVSTGVDNRPRSDNKVPWPSGGTVWVQQPTPGQLAAELQNALAWNTNYPSAAEANTVLVYAWNEFDEGGWICPTLYFGADRLNAIATVLGGTQQGTATPPTPGPNIALGKTATASSQQGTNLAASALDGDPGTGWSAATGDTAGAWLSVDIGASITFNRVVIREQSSQCITNYKIQYDNGTDWVDVAAATTAGPFAPAPFRAVTARKLRVLIMAATAAPRIDELEAYYTPNFQPPSDGLACSWDFEGNSHDAVGSRHARLSGGVAYDTGVLSQALHLDGVNGHAIVADTDGNHTSKLDGLGAITVATWVCLDQLPSLPCLLVNKNGGYALTINTDGTGGFALATDSAAWGSTGTVAGFSTPLATGVWHHVVGVYDGSSAKVYLDGQLAGTGSQPIAGVITNSAQPLIFGKGAGGINSFLKGSLDDTRIFNRGLDAMEVRELRDASLSDCRGQWRLDEGSGLVSADSSGNANRATLVNGGAWSLAFLGQGISLDGVDDYVEMPDGGALGGMDTLTVSAWLNVGRLPAAGFSVTPLEKQSVYRFVIGSGGSGHFALRTASNGWYSAGTTAPFNTPLPLDSWHHLVGTYDGNWVRMYVDGVLQGTGTQAVSGPIYHVNAPLRLGHKAGANLEYFSGMVDEVEVRSRALSGAEVQSLYNSARAFPFDAWRSTKFAPGELADQNTSGHAADPDRDGIPNGLEWILGGEPLARDPDRLPQITSSTDNTILAFARVDESESTTTLAVQWSTDLKTWNDVPVGSGSSDPDAHGVTVLIAENGVGPDTITVTVPRANGPSGRLFVRIKAALP